MARLTALSAELRHRYVLRITAAYTVVFRVVIPEGATGFSVFDLPDWAG